MTIDNPVDTQNHGLNTTSDIPAECQKIEQVNNNVDSPFILTTNTPQLRPRKPKAAAPLKRPRNHKPAFQPSTAHDNNAEMTEIGPDIYIYKVDSVKIPIFQQRDSYTVEVESLLVEEPRYNKRKRSTSRSDMQKQKAIKVEETVTRIRSKTLTEEPEKMTIKAKMKRIPNARGSNQFKIKPRLVAPPASGVNAAEPPPPAVLAILDFRLKHQQINPDDFQLMDTVLGEGQVGTVHLAKYKGLLVACKTKRLRTKRDLFYIQMQRELKFAAKLSVCRYVNRYIGWTWCKRWKVESDMLDSPSKIGYKLYVLQRYVANGDARSYLDKRESTFRPAEVLQASICLFSALTDAHKMGIGIVDLKLENFLIDSSGAGWLTDFGSCIELSGRKVVDLEEERVAWTRNVAAPEMINKYEFCKASDIFMGSYIIAELLCADLSDEEFNTLIVNRNDKTGHVAFSSNSIHQRYQPFFAILERGLQNDKEKRPTANSLLDYLLAMKNSATAKS